MFLPFHDDNPTRRVPVVTYAIIAVNVLALLWYWRLPEGARDLVTLRRGFIPRRVEQLYSGQPIAVPLQVPVVHPLFGRAILERPVRLEPNRAEILLSLFTCMFLHAGWLHLIGNMWFLGVFGNNVEDRLGPVVFLLFYLAGGLMASAVHWAVAPASAVPVIGASGAVAAVLGAYAITWPWARVHTLLFLVVFITIIDVPALLVLGVWFGTQVLSATGWAIPNLAGGVAWWAHVGGFLAGMALMPVLGWLLGAEGPTKPAAVEILGDPEA